MINNELDAVDYAILNLLQKDAQITHKAIALETSMSANSINVRIKRLITEGYIKKYTVILNHKKIGRSLIAYTQVQVKPHTQESLTAFRDAAVKVREVMECLHLTGKFDYLLKVAVKDMDEYDYVLMNKLSKLPNVDNYESMFVLSEAKKETAYQL